MALKTMSISKLVNLRAQVEATLSAKVTAERRELQSRLASLERVGTGRATGGRGGARGKVEPKYRNPDNPAETWAGRGLKPRWLSAALKAGKKLEDFAIGGPANIKKAQAKKASARRTRSRAAPPATSNGAAP